MSYYTNKEIAIPADYKDDNWANVYQVEPGIDVELLTSEQIAWLKEQLSARVFLRRTNKMRIVFTEDLFVMLETEEKRRSKL